MSTEKILQQVEEIKKLRKEIAKLKAESQQYSINKLLKKTQELYQYISNGEAASVQIWIQENKTLDLNLIFLDKSSELLRPLEFAIYKHKPDVLNILINNGAKLNLPMEDYRLKRYLPVHYAVICCNVEGEYRQKALECLFTILDNGGLMMFKAVTMGEQNQTLLEFILINPHLELLELSQRYDLKEMGILDEEDSNTFTPLQYAVHYDGSEYINRHGFNAILHTQGFIDTLCRLGADINKLGTFNYTPLMMAIRNNDFKLARALIFLGADPNRPRRGDSDSTLYIAVKTNAIECVKELLTPLKTEGSYTEKNHQTDVSNNDIYLKQNYDSRRPININTKGTRGYYTPLMISVIHGYTECFEELLKYDADINIVAGTGDKAIHLAANFNRPEMIKTLVQKGASLGEQNSDGFTPAVIAVIENSVEALRVIMMEGNHVDLNIPAFLHGVNKSPLRIALESKKNSEKALQCIELLMGVTSTKTLNMVYSWLKGKGEIFRAMDWGRSPFDKARTRRAQIILESKQRREYVTRLVKRGFKTDDGPIHKLDPDSGGLVRKFVSHHSPFKLKF